MTDNLMLLEGEADHGYGAETLGVEEQTGLHRLMTFADTDGDISHLLTANELDDVGHKVVEDYETDDASRSEWKTTVEAAFKRAAQERPELAKNTPWIGCSDVDYPLLTVASQQFNARAYPAIIRGDEAVGIKVFGDQPKPMPPSTQGADPQQLQQLQQLFAQNQKWDAKTARAKRVKTYLNYLLFYLMYNWEDSVDNLLTQLPIAGTGFKKVYYDPMRGTCSDYVNPLNLTVNMATKDLRTAPRITQDFTMYPYEIRAKQAQGLYRDVELTQLSDDEEEPRVLLEQHRMQDLDDDDIDEPYIVTVDRETQQVLRIEAAYDEDDVIIVKDRVVEVKRFVPFVKFPFLRDPKGRFYEIGFGQLLEPLTEVINTAINELLDAGHAQVAGGGFIAGGLRLQNPGQSSSLKWRPGEYKVANMPGGNLQQAVWERTLPNPSQVIYNLLEMMLGAAKEIGNIKDVLTGEAPNTAPVGTTQALIEQGLQGFTAIYKRVYRAMREEFQLIYKCEAKWGGEKSAALYSELMDDPDADFAKDFAQAGMDITPVSDPTVVTHQQRLAKAQVIQQVAASFPNAINQQAAARRILEAADIDNPDELVVQPTPPPGMAEDIQNTAADTELKKAGALEKQTGAAKNQALTAKALAETGVIAGEAHQEGMMDGIQGALATQGPGISGGPASVAGQPGNPMGAESAPAGVGGPEGGVGGGVVGDAASGPAPVEGASDTL